MARTPHRLLRVLSLCPICFDQAGGLTDGARAGAAVLAITMAGILFVVGRFAWRVARHVDDPARASNGGQEPPT